MTIQYGTVIQNAFIVNDLETAMHRWHAMFGTGPFLVNDHIPLEDVVYRGAEVELDISVALAQSGDIQIELIQQHSDGPSCYRDQFAPGEEGFHHVAILCEDHEAAYRQYVDAGMVSATEFGSGEQKIAYMDARAAIGAMIELYPDIDGIRMLFDMVRNIGKGWDGRNLVWTP
jgi:hypothetical protein